MIDSVKSVATCLSALRAALSSTSAERWTWGGRPGLVKRSGMPPVPSTCSWSSRTATVDWPSGASVPCSFIVWSILSIRGRSVAGQGGAEWPSGGLRSEPHRAADEHGDAEDPDEHALGHRAEVAQAQATRVVGLVDRVQVADDVVLVLGREVAVVEHRHRLRAGEHRLVDVLALDVAQARGELAAGQRATGTGEVVAHRAVDAEQLGTLGDVALTAGVGGVGDGRAGGQRGDIGGHLRDLLVGE